MPKFARPNSYTGKQSNQNWTGDARSATLAEAISGANAQTYVSPKTLAAVASTIVDASLLSPGPIGSTTPNTGSFTTLDSTGATILSSSAGVTFQAGNSTGTVGFFGSTGALRATQGALTNNVTSGGTTGTIADFTDLTTYATDAPTIRNDIYQLSLALANVITALRAYGMLA